MVGFIQILENDCVASDHEMDHYDNQIIQESRSDTNYIILSKYETFFYVATKKISLSFVSG